MSGRAFKAQMAAWGKNERGLAEWEEALAPRDLRQ